MNCKNCFIYTILSTKECPYCRDPLVNTNLNLENESEYETESDYDSVSNSDVIITE